MLSEIVSDLRTEIGLPAFKVTDKVLCFLYRTFDIQFQGTIHATTKSLNTTLYLIDCPLAYGFLYSDLAIKAKDVTNLDQSLYYRWVEGNTLILIYP